MLRHTFIAVSLILVCAACTTPPPPWETALSRDHQLVGKIWAPDESAFVPKEKLLRITRSADFVFLGEKHDNPDHHLLQSWLVNRLAAGGKRPAVVFEMIGENRQGDIDRFLAESPTNATGLGTALEWDKSGWPDWKYYQPIAEAALNNGAPLIAGNLSRKEVRNVGRKGMSVLPEQRRQRLGLDKTMRAEYGNAMLEIVAEGHCGLMPRTALGPMVTVQRVRDAVLSDNMVRAFANKELDVDSAILIAGSGHARKDIGAPMVVRTMAPDTNAVTIAFIEVDDTANAPNDYASRYFAGALPFDFVWFTPRANDRDYCAELRERFAGHKNVK